MFQVLALYQSNWRDCGLCVGLYTENGVSGLWSWGKKIKLVEWKASVDAMGLRVPILEDILQKKKQQFSLCTFTCAYNQQRSFDKKGA